MPDQVERNAIRLIHPLETEARQDPIKVLTVENIELHEAAAPWRIACMAG